MPSRNRSSRVAKARARLRFGPERRPRRDGRSQSGPHRAPRAPAGHLEAYPQLKSNQNFLPLQDELTGTENRIATARQDYNEAVNQFNSYIRRFPYNLTAKMFGHGTPRTYFEAKAGTDEPPAVKFN